MRSSPQFVAMAGKLDQAKRHARDLDARIEFERKAHPMRAALGIGVSAKLGKELVQTLQAVERAKAKLNQFEKDPRVIGRFKAQAGHEAEGIMAARHETKLLKPVYEQALSLIKAEREQKRENGRAKGHERGRGRGR
jgi:hypothetical protein